MTRSRSSFAHYLPNPCRACPLPSKAWTGLHAHDFGVEDKEESQYVAFRHFVWFLAARISNGGSLKLPEKNNKQMSTLRFRGVKRFPTPYSHKAQEGRSFANHDLGP